MSDKIKVLVVEPMKPCEVREISGLDEMQAIVGGHIQAVYPYQDEVALVCNEDGKYLDLPDNRPLTNDRGIPYDVICGTFFLAGLGEEDFVSLTDEQIEKFSALYDNMMVLPAERAEAQKEITPDDDGMSYFAIACQVSFRIPAGEQWTDTQKKAFADHVTGIFYNDGPLAERLVSELSFSFHGDCAEVEYSFADRTTDKSSAELFSEQCVRKVQAQLEGCGCKMAEIDCFAEKLDDWEDDLSFAKDQSKGQKTQEKKKGHHHER